MSRISNIFFWVPNTITSLNLVCGILAVFFGIDGQLGWASVFILAAAVFDFCDGLSARLLKAYSTIGKELDSLADLISFGLAPATIVFTLMEYSLFSKNQPIQEIEATWSQWLFLFTSFVIPIAGAFRLAKFNTDDRQHDEFLGLPIPANAIFFASLGLISELGNNFIILPFILNRHIILASIFIFSFLMVSEIPMFSFKVKNLSFKENWYRYVFLGTVILLSIFMKLYVLPIVIIWYVLFSIVLYFFRLK